LPETLVLDFFAGSGTTAQAVMDVARRTNVDMRYILVEMDDCFDFVLLPRIKKLTFVPEWKNGKPLRQISEEEAKYGPKIIKYIRLESYEDALNNISFTPSKGQKLLEFDDYMLKYMLEWETKDSDTFLNIEKLESPFSYKMSLAQGQETKERLVDLPETFNFLLGLHVKTRRIYQNGKRKYLVYRGKVDHREIVVIWRDTKAWKKKDFEQDKKFIAEQKLTEAADEVFVNSDSLVPNAKSLDPVFKNRMFAKV
jgi:adenine-specific DNA-methyltransferase